MKRFTLRSLPFFLLGLLLIFFLISCSKNETQPTIDVTNLWETAPLGQPMNIPTDKQWESKTFSAAEMNLFASLDTVNLSGTVMPLKVTGPGIKDPSTPSMVYPNPFSKFFNITFAFDSSFAGNVIIKLVIVDQSLHPVLKQAVRLSTNSGRTQFRFWPDLPAGNFRLYYTLSAQSNPHFHKSWGNIKNVL
ncbi:hypothetical protein LX87_03054 [Larkinella arboricola]|uniref:Uncharacterized protein n=1 Tax=Larkinella arboricola TaxID=643671 RepID=A0A327WZJ0_LARAB|nr:hypothetical protein LX87_03054 [Larkinella arboricola]